MVVILLQRVKRVSNPKKVPKFLRQSWQAYKRLGKKWRRPQGWQSKLRRGERDKGYIPSPGYGAPRNLKGLHPSGKREVLVFNINDLKKVDKEKDAVKIAHTVGKRKRTDVLKKAEELKIKVLNP